jgi:hypothetical protein
MYATTSALLCVHAVRSARPRPFCSRCSTFTSSSFASACARSSVLSLLALSAIVNRNGNVNSRFM